MAAGKAFSFGYAEHAELLRAAGADVVEFDPLIDPLPDGTDAVLLPGGFPEQFTAELSANDVVRRQINELAAAGAPIHAECAGLIYLASELDGYPMCGVLAGSARFTPHLTLAYRDAVAVADSSLYSVGQRVVGHEFHRTAVTFTDSYQPAWVYQARSGSRDRHRARRRRARRRARVVPAHPSGRDAGRGGALRRTRRRTPSGERYLAAPTRRSSPLSLPGDREPLPRRIAAGRQEGRRGRRGHGCAAPVAAADRQRRRRARHLPHAPPPPSRR